MCASNKYSTMRRCAFYDRNGCSMSSVPSRPPSPPSGSLLCNHISHFIRMVLRHVNLSATPRHQEKDKKGNVKDAVLIARWPTRIPHDINLEEPFCIEVCGHVFAVLDEMLKIACSADDTSRMRGILVILRANVARLVESRVAVDDGVWWPCLSTRKSILTTLESIVDTNKTLGHLAAGVIGCGLGVFLPDPNRRVNFLSGLTKLGAPANPSRAALVARCLHHCSEAVITSDVLGDDERVKIYKVAEYVFTSMSSMISHKTVDPTSLDECFMQIDAAVRTMRSELRIVALSLSSQCRQADENDGTTHYLTAASMEALRMLTMRLLRVATTGDAPSLFDRLLYEYSIMLTHVSSEHPELFRLHDATAMLPAIIKLLECVSKHGPKSHPNIALRNVSSSIAELGITQTTPSKDVDSSPGPLVWEFDGADPPNPDVRSSDARHIYVSLTPSYPIHRQFFVS